MSHYGVIILEGPDGSGKSELARALTGWMGPEKSQVIKSPPGRTTKWLPGYRDWARDRLTESYQSKKTFILDRTPEISELVYGTIVRHGTRLSNPMRTLYRLKHPDILIILCKPNTIPHRHEHEDPQGNDMSKVYQEIEAGYELVRSLLLGSHKVSDWDYMESEPQWLSYFILRHLNFRNLGPLTEEHFKP